MSFEKWMSYISIEVGSILQELSPIPNAHLVTRTTGRAVRAVIEDRLCNIQAPGLSYIDFSEIGVMDFSCADEVVARLLVRFVDTSRPREIFFILKGLSPSHLEPLSEVLQRQKILAIHQNFSGSVELLGSVSPAESKVWDFMENNRVVSKKEITSAFVEEDQRAWARLVHQRVIFQEINEDRYHSLGSLVGDAGK